MSPFLDFMGLIITLIFGNQKGRKLQMLAALQDSEVSLSSLTLIRKQGKNQKTHHISKQTLGLLGNCCTNLKLQ